MDYRKKFQQKKSLSQVFLREDWPCRKMLEQLQRHQIQAVVEVGPGPGILTRVLLAGGVHVTAVERDGRLVERLEALQAQNSYPGRLTVVHQDVLKFDLAAWMGEQGSGPIAVCGNIPYHISSALLMWLLPHLESLRLATLMVQLEFGERLTSPPAAKSYGSLSVYTQLRAKAQLDFTVPRMCFHPVPKVDSAVVTLKPLAQRESAATLKAVEILSRRAFSQRRKKLANSLSPFFTDGQPEAFVVDLSRRVDTLSPQEFVAMAKSLARLNPQRFAGAGSSE